MSSAAEARAAELRESASHEADELRRHAMADSRRVLERIDSLERLTSDIVEALRTEIDQLGTVIAKHSVNDRPSAEARRPAPADKPVAPRAPAEPAEPEPPHEAEAAAEPEPEAPEESEQEPREAAATAESEDTPAEAEEGAPAAKADTELAAGEAEAQPQPPVPAEHAAPQRRGLFGRMRSRRRGRPFIDAAGQCAVCRRSIQAESYEQLRANGWQIQGNTGLCPDCQRDGWDLRSGGAVAREDS